MILQITFTDFFTLMISLCFLHELLNKFLNITLKNWMLYRHVIFGSNLYVVNMEQRCVKKYRRLYTVVLIFDSSEFLRLVMDKNTSSGAPGKLIIMFSVTFLCVCEVF